MKSCGVAVARSGVGVLAERLELAWRTRRKGMRLTDTPAFGPQGLTLGCGARLPGLEGDRPSGRASGTQARLLTLLSAGYARAIGPEVLGHLSRAERCWREGDAYAASLHLALSGLGKLAEPEAAARRLFMAEMFLDAGAEPDRILQAMGLEKLAPSHGYNAAEPRIPRGNGIMSGRWTAQDQSVLAQTGKRELTVLARFLIRRLTQRAIPLIAGEAVSGLGMALISDAPPPGEFYNVRGTPGLRIGRQAGDLLWQFYYSGSQGEQRVNLHEKDGVFLNSQGKPVGKRLPGRVVAFDLPAISPALQKDEPQLCPAPSKDYYGQGPGSRSRRYEDQVKAYVNPTDPTLSGLGYRLVTKVSRNGFVMFDDCQKLTGIMIEIKGPGWGKFLLRALKSEKMRQRVIDKLLRQGRAQSDAADGRFKIIWFFADQHVLEYVKKLFQDDGLSRISFQYLPEDTAWRKVNINSEPSGWARTSRRPRSDSDFSGLWTL